MLWSVEPDEILVKSELMSRLTSVCPQAPKSGHTCQPVPSCVPCDDVCDGAFGGFSSSCSCSAPRWDGWSAARRSSAIPSRHSGRPRRWSVTTGNGTATGYAAASLRRTAWLVNALGVDYFGHVVVVIHGQPGPDDSELVHIGELWRIRDLLIHGSRVTDSGLVHLDGLTNLRSLSLDGTQVTSAGLVAT